MPIKVTCSNCGGVLHAPDDAGGKRGRCPTCGNILPIPAVAGGGGGDVPEPPAAGGAGKPSFADFALGPTVGPPPAADPRGTARSSIPFSSGAGEPAAPPQRARPPADPAEPRRPTDPFARKGPPQPKGAAPAAPSDVAVKGWRSARGGLAWVQAANFLLFIPLVLLPAYYTAIEVMKATSADGKAELIPYRDPGYLGLSGVNSDAELPILLIGGPMVLALLLNLFGRLGFAGAPKQSAVGGPALLSALATLIAIGCVVLCIFPPIVQLIGGDKPFPTGTPLFEGTGGTGLLQRIGLFLGVAVVLVGEFWFASAVGRVGSALRDGKPAARSTRYLMWLGLAVIGMVGTGAVIPGPHFGLWAPGYENRSTADEYPTYSRRLEKQQTVRGYEMVRPQLTDNPAYEAGRETNELVGGQWEKHVGPQIDNAGKFKSVIAPAVFLLGGLLGWVMYLRMVGAARGAMAGWLDAHGGSA